MKILVGYTPTPQGRAALRRAAEEAQLRRAELAIVYYVRVAVAIGDVAGEFRAVEAELERRRVELEGDGLTVTVRAAMGARSPASELLDAADADDVDLIVLGLRRRSLVGKLVMGSTAQEILLEASCPVLAVKGDGA